MSAMNEDDIDDLIDRLESGCASPEDIAAAAAMATFLADWEILNIDVFSGDESDVRVLSAKVVKGRTAHVDHYSQRPIPVGARHLVIREMCEGEFLTTRHSELSLWMLWQGYDPSALTPTPSQTTSHAAGAEA